jgi:dihydroorotate dehydrogenase (fumarate)
MDLTTRYLGLDLANPFVIGASPLADDLDMVMRLEDAGAAAIVARSLFEEDVVRQDDTCDRYLDHLRRLKERTRVPVIGSLNGTTAEGWLGYARLIERAGADALELNFFYTPTGLDETSLAVEGRVIDIAAVLKESLSIPLAVKLSPFYSALPHLARQLDRFGVNGLVLFNRFYEPDINPEALDATPVLALSAPAELPLRLRWTSILYGQVKASIAVTGGIHDARDAIKAIMAGADALQIVSALLRGGPGALRRIRLGVEEWAEQHEYESIRELRGRASMSRSADPAAFARGNYVKLLNSFHGGAS